MKTLQKMRQAGFTMIELLVVIAVIGVLSVAVLSSINPIEQINKGRDTRTRSDAAQVINAVDRFVALDENYPWFVEDFDEDGSPDVEGTIADEFDFTPTDATDAEWSWLDLLATRNEIKDGFVTRVKADESIFIVKPAGANKTMYACFIPVSNSFVSEAASKCQDGLTPDAVGDVTPCATTDGSTDPDNMLCLP